jgi:ATP-dependent RNA helicase DDX10/DBP4
VQPPGGDPPRTAMPLDGKKVKPSRRAVRSNKLDEESALQELARRVADEAPAHASVACPAREFVQLPLSDSTLAGLSKAGFSHMTEIQRTSIPHALAGRDLQGGARTGSGKTLAFIVPMLECLYRARWSRMDGLGGLVISPTRELVWRTHALCAAAPKHAFAM